MPPEQSAWRDPALLLDMKLSAEDAVQFVADLDEAAFRMSDLHQSAVIRKLEVLGEAAGKGLRRVPPQPSGDSMRPSRLTRPANSH